ncbi:MAG: hypothetical protein K2X62_05850 [Beijerinckiaceae bacterium]|nr:hypothetical protein [Beijerinckiaceae bacterium]
MLKKLLATAALVASALTSASAADLISKSAPPAPAPAPAFFIFADTQLSWRFETRAREPGNQRNIQKHIFAITHFDVWKYGTNFANIDFLKSNSRDPANGGGDGAFEVYGLYRGTLSGNALSGSRPFSVGPIKDVSLSFGFDANTKNTAFAPQKRDVVGGLQVAFDVPGYLTASVHAYKEWNHCGLSAGGVAICNRNVEFDTTAQFEIGYMQPLAFTGLPLNFSGYTNFVMPKGKDGFGAQTKTEILSSNRLTLDIGKLAFGKANMVDAFLGYKYWRNKFGNNYRTNAGSIENQIFFGLAWHAL